MKNTRRYLAVGVCFLLFIFLPFPLKAQLSEVDTILEPSLSNTCIVNTKQIKIPSYPNAYNPSLIPYKDGYLLSFRFRMGNSEEIKDCYRKDLSFVGVARLNKEFKVYKKSIQLLDIRSHSSKFSLTAEDARLLHVNEHIFIFFNDLPLSKTPGKFSMYFGELVEEKDRLVFKEPVKLLHYPYAREIEKNWSPFSLGNRLYMIYSTQPWIILEVDVDTGYCKEITHTILPWSWYLGEIRGGTPAYLVSKDLFLTFFHSSFPAETPKKQAYVMGAYTFSKDSGFSVRTITPLPLGNLTDYTQDNALKVIFPGGMVVQDNFIHVAWGKSDKQIFITTFDREKLLSSMEPLF